MADPWAAVGGTAINRSPTLDWSSVGGAPVKRAPSLTPGKYGPGIKSEILKDLPGAYGFGGERTVARNRQVGGVPDSAHLTGNAWDFQPPKGMTRAQALDILKKDPKFANYQILDEGPGAAHSSGPHLHVGATGSSAVIADQPKPRIKGTLTAKKPSPADSWAAVGGKPVAFKSSAPKEPPKAAPADSWAAVGGKPVAPPDQAAGPVPGLGGLLGSAAKGTVKSIERKLTLPYHVWEHPEAYVQRAKDAGKAIAQGVMHPFKTAESILKGTVESYQGAVAAGAKTVGLGKYLTASDEAAARNLGKDFEHRPLMTAAQFVPLVGPAAKAASRVAGTESHVGKALHYLHSSVSPTRATPAARATGLFIRKATGSNGADADRIGHQMARLSKWEAKGTPEQNQHFLDFVESRSEHAGGPGGVYLGQGQAATKGEYEAAKKLGMTSEDLRAANAIRDANDHWYKKAYDAVLANTDSKLGFIKDHFAHMWEEPPEEVARRMSAFSTKQGSRRYFYKRTIPTIKAGIEAGLTPKYGIMQSVQVYSENMANFVASHEIQLSIKKAGNGGWFRPGQHPPGWVPAKGALAERAPQRRAGGRKGKFPEDRMVGGGNPQLTGPDKMKLLQDRTKESRELTRHGYQYEEAPKLLEGGPKRLGGPGEPLQIEGAGLKSANPTPEPEPKLRPQKPVQKEVFYMKPEVARIYNNHISQAFDPSKGGMEAAGHYAYKAAVNAMLWKLGFGGYHAFTMSLESALSHYAAGFENLSRGKVGAAAKRFAMGTVPGLSQVTHLAKGDAIREAILYPERATPFTAKLAKHFAESGGRVNMYRDYQGTHMKTFYEALKEGTLKKEIMSQGAKMFKGDKKALSTLEMGANMLTSMNGWLFQDVIPRLKMGAWREAMEDYLKANPNATPEMIEERAAQYLDSVDNRMGEMARDNLFWSRKTQQMASAALMSPTWKIGSWREMGMGLHDIPKSIKGIKSGEGITSRTAYLLAMGTVIPLTSSIYQYLKTGKAPEGEDFIAPQTGGTDPRVGLPERALLPGNQKEIFEAVHGAQSGPPGMLNYATSGMNVIPQAGGNLIENKDFAGQPIYGEEAAPGAFGRWASDNFNPVVFSMLEKRLKGSDISTPERLMGVRTAPTFMETGFKPSAKELKRNQRMKKYRARAAARQKGLYQ